MKPQRTWILIADGGRARVVEATGVGHGLHEVEASEAANPAPRSHLLGRAPSGRVYESVGHQRHAITPRQDPHQALETSFAIQIAARLDSALKNDSYDRLVLVAPAHMLGDLRGAVTPEVRKVILAEVSKDLTKVPNNEIAGHLAGVMVF